MSFSPSGPFHFAAPKEFSGKKEDFEEFSFKLRAYLCLMDPKYNDDLNAIELNPDLEITDANFIDSSGTVKTDLLQRSTSLQWILVGLCSGSASAQLRRESNTTDGFESWRKVIIRYKIPSRARAVG